MLLVVGLVLIALALAGALVVGGTGGIAAPAAGAGHAVALARFAA